MSALMAKIANVDVDHVYFGLGVAIALEQVKAGDFVFGPTDIIPSLPSGAIYVAEDCDLPAGKYRLVKTETLAPIVVKIVPAAPPPADGSDPAPAQDGVDGNVAVMRVPVWRFDPLPAAVVRDGPAMITAERALYEQLKLAHQTVPGTVAPAALTWAKGYETTWDGGNGAELAYFRALDKQ